MFQYFHLNKRIRGYYRFPKIRFILWGTLLHQGYSAIVEISSEFVEISSELVEFSSELVEFSSELVSTILELLIISV